MDFFTILAQTTQTASQTAESTVAPIDVIWGHVTSLNLLEALMFVSFGSVCLFYGWRIFKILVIISFALLGLFLGVTASDLIGGGHQILAGLIGLGLLAAISIPLMRWAVSILGAVAGGILTSGIWYACGLTDKYIWAGALMGVIAGGMISFIIFKIAVMLFSSLGGSGLMVTGLLALLYLWPKTQGQVQTLVFDNKWFLPAALIVSTAAGIFLQNKFIKGHKNWNI
ncbi:MAG: hypothetical protein KAI59_03865 [Planctomycetes bacterium]|nr:hypothetical protein [Planctomycetota bacterium]